MTFAQIFQGNEYHRGITSNGKYPHYLEKNKPLSQIFEGSFEVESYLQYQGISFVERFDANSYLYLTRCMDRFDLSEQFNGKLSEAFVNNISRWFFKNFQK